MTDRRSTPPDRAGAGAPGPVAGPEAVRGLPGPWLVADIGGTNARFGWVEAGSTEVMRVATMAAAGHAGPADAAMVYLQGVAQALGARYRAPRAGAFAVATAVGGDRVEFTNSRWAFSRRAAQHGLGLDELLVLNDFEALALSLPRLRRSQVRPFGAVPVPAAPAAPSALAVIGPGTGLGVAGLVPTRHGWVAVPGEGGHASLAASRRLRDGAAGRRAPPLRPRLGRAAAVGHRPARAACRGGPRAGQPALPLTAGEIVERGLAAQDAVCSRTIDSFCALLGGFAGNVALVLGARGGVYIGGGIVPRLGERFFESRFRERFEAKGRFQGYLQAIPTALITDTLAALDRGGAGAGTARPLRSSGVHGGNSFRSNTRSASHTAASAAMASDPPTITPRR